MLPRLCRMDVLPHHWPTHRRLFRPARLWPRVLAGVAVVAVFLLAGLVSGPGLR